MIPLGRWLVERGGGAGVGVAGPLPLELLSSGDDGATVEMPCEVDPGIQALTDRLSELEAALAAAVEGLDEERALHSARERELERRLGEHLVAELRTGLEAALSKLQHDVEAAAADALLPFLGNAAASLSAGQLTVLIRSVLRDTAAPLLEVKAPARLHGALSAALDEAGVTASLKDDDTIELVFSTHAARFQDLADRWLMMIEGKSA